MDEAKVAATAQEHPPTSLRLGFVAFVLIGLSVFWYLGQVVKFGFAFDRVDLLGGHFILSGIAVATALRSQGEKVGENGFLAFACALAMAATALFLGQFLSTFDPFYRVGGRLWPYLLRGLFLAAGVATLFALRPHRFFRFPKWLLILTCVAIAGWLFVYAWPSMVREWYGTRSEPSALFPQGMLTFTRRNPERGIQGQMLFASAVALLVLVVVGRISYFRSRGRPESAGALE